LIDLGAKAHDDLDIVVGRRPRRHPALGRERPVLTGGGAANPAADALELGGAGPPADIEQHLLVLRPRDPRQHPDLGVAKKPLGHRPIDRRQIRERPPHPQMLVGGAAAHPDPPRAPRHHRAGAGLAQPPRSWSSTMSWII
jgi:hypothetical protein